MLIRTNAFCTFLVTASFAFLLAGSATAQKASTPKSPDVAVIAQPHVTQLLLLMDTDKTGKISKDEWIKFMAAEFDRLDKTKAGELNLRELKESEARPTRIAAVGK